MDPAREVVVSGASRKHKSLEVACKLNELWWADLRLQECRLKITEKQLAGHEQLADMVEALTNALGHSGLVGGLTHGRAGGGGPMWKGKEKAADEGSEEEESDDGDGEGEEADGRE